MKELYPRECYGRISLSKSNYLKEEDFWKDVADIQRVLTNNHRTTILQHDDAGVYNLYYALDKEKDMGVYTAIVEEDDEDYTGGCYEDFVEVVDGLGTVEFKEPTNAEKGCTTRSEFFNDVEYNTK